MLSQPLSSKPSAAKSSATGTVGDRRKRQSPFSERAGASECSHERAVRSAPRPGAVSETYAESWEGTRSQLFLDNKRIRTPATECRRDGSRLPEHDRSDLPRAEGEFESVCDRRLGEWPAKQGG